jgi:acyl-coenzyme A thioesterase PaaI-like protein
MQDPGAPYPPPQHLLRDLRLEVEHGEDGVSRARMPVVDALRNDHGTVRLGVLGTLADVVGGGLAALAAAPDWIATSDLTVHLAPAALPVAADGEWVHATGRVLRRGASTVVLEVDFAATDGGPRYGFATLGFALLPRRDINPVIDRANSGRMAIAGPRSGFAAPLLDTIGLELADGAGALRLEVAPYVQNSFRALQGGMISLLADVAAEHALGAATGTPMVPVNLQLTYLELGKVGPVETSARVDHIGDHEAHARVDVFDTGQGGVHMSVARVAAVPVGRA